MIRVSLLATLAATVLSGPISAQVSPHGTFGSLPPESFGGDGIPTDAVMLNTFDGVTLGLSATPRYTSPALTNDGAGTFFATTGVQPQNCASLTCSTWNFSWFIGGQNVQNYSYKLLYDFDPASGNGGHGSLDYLAFINADSQNLGFAFLATSAPPLWTAPSFGPFDANANGNYTFALQQFDANLALVGSVGMEVIVGSGATSTVPEPATMTLLATGLAGLVGARRRKKTS